MVQFAILRDDMIAMAQGLVNFFLYCTVIEGKVVVFPDKQVALRAHAGHRKQIIHSSVHILTEHHSLIITKSEPRLEQ